MIDYIAALFGITGSILLAFGSKDTVKYSFICYWLGSILWIIFGITHSIHSLTITNIVFIIVESIGFYKWSKKK